MISQMYYLEIRVTVGRHPTEEEMKQAVDAVSEHEEVNDVWTNDRAPELMMLTARAFVEEDLQIESAAHSIGEALVKALPNCPVELEAFFEETTTYDVYTYGEDDEE